MPSILITGANRGLGRALTDLYAGKGWDVIATARSDEDVEMLDALDRVDALDFDANDERAIPRLAEQLHGRPIDVFLNNAGIYGPRTPERDGWLDLFEVNVIVPTLLAEALKPNVAASDRKVMAVMTSKMGSIADNGSGGSIPYRSSKAAVNAAWKSLANDYRGDNIAIVMLHPGWVRTDMGGPNGLIDADESAAGLYERIEETSLSNSGRFVDYSGADIPW
jgi:NAD(P)-dependent dehydrogenase (short-subunit alcohol dehydrogenase family)